MPGLVGARVIVAAFPDNPFWIADFSRNLTHICNLHTHICNLAEEKEKIKHIIIYGKLIVNLCE
jgi:hypothetical protein